ncbi:hypothetical protein C4561_02375 [candidate division WWE3 bacterium]|jgi:hypothetical protein|uniref:Uncharacterized protein n=1 Tax=candidate division WWE3 bacterium TaxID=2053526 RepID=A0A3A4ZDT1_UNCKA|nr:MAG: hypothetical protein C4561_02375 [candidate division WWE3 bacterium]
MKNSGYYIKTLFLALIIFFVSYFLTKTISEPIKNQNYFSFSAEYAAKIILLMLVNLYVFSLTVGAWNKWEQYIIVSIPVSLAIFFAIFPISPAYAFILAFLSGTLISFDVYKSTRISQLMIRFDPKIILRLSTSGLLFVFSIVGGVLVILYSYVSPEFNIGKEISSIVEKPLKSIVETQLKNNLEQQLIPLNLTGKEEVNSSVEDLLKQFGLELEAEEIKSNVSETEITEQIIQNLDIKSIVEKEINGFVGPYKNLVHPLLAVLMFALFQFYAAIALFLYIITVDGIFWLARKTGFFKSTQIDVKKEILKF